MSPNPLSDAFVFAASAQAQLLKFPATPHDSQRLRILAQSLTETLYAVSAVIEHLRSDEVS